MIKKFYKTVTVNGQKITVLNFKAIADEGYPVNILITERGSEGKTFNAKEYWLEKYLHTGSKAIWIFNNKTQLDKNYQRFTYINQRFNSEWERFNITTRGLRDKSTGEIVLYFVHLTSAFMEKGGRDGSIGDIFYDEFNEMLYRLPLQSTYLESLLHTFTNPHSKNKDVRLWIFGNQKTMAVPLLADLQIFKITKELETYDDIILIYSPMYNLIDIKKKHKDNWLWKFSNRLGLAESSFGNINLIDNDEGVDKDFNLYNYKSIGFIKIQQRFIQLFTSDHSGYMYAKWTNDPDMGNCVWFLPEDKDYGLPVNLRLKDELFDRVIQKTVMFDTIITKMLICTL